MAIALFRVDSSARIGGGHLYRCLTLAKALHQEGWQCIFRCQRLTGNLMYLLDDLPFIKHSVDDDTMTSWDPATDARLCRDWLVSARMSVDLIIVDHYQLDRTWHRVLKPMCRHLMVIDDLANRYHECDVLLDQSAGRRSDDYRNWLPAECRVLAGTDYALLRNEFSQLRQQAIEKRMTTTTPHKILVAMSATDPDNVTLLALQALSSSIGSRDDATEVHVIITSRAPGLSSLEQFAATCEFNIVMHVDAHNVAEILVNVDFAIAAAGTSLLERQCLALPGIVICIADNQTHIAAEALRNGSVLAVLTPKQLPDKLPTLLEKIKTQPALYQHLATHAAKQCDGLGSQRVIAALKHLPSSTWLRPVSQSDCEFLFELQQQPSVRRYARNARPPTWPEHAQWFDRTLSNSMIHYCIITQDETPCGYVRIEPKTLDSVEGYEVSIAVDSARQGQQLGSKALTLLIAGFSEKPLFAFIKKQNKASIRAFTKSGFTPLLDDWYIYRNATQ